MGLLFKKKVIPLPTRLHLQIESGQKIWYELEEGRPIKQMVASMVGETDNLAEPLKAGDSFISMTQGDFRLKTEKPLNKSDAKSSLIRSSGSSDLLSVLNLSKETGLIYGCALADIKTERAEPLSVYSLLEITDRLLKQKSQKIDDETSVTIKLNREDEPDLLIFIDYKQGSVSYSAAIYEDDAEQAIDLHLVSVGFSNEVVRHEFNGDDLFKAIKNLKSKPYPIELPLVSMVNIDAITPLVTVIFLAGAVGSWGYWFIKYNSLNKTQTEIEVKRSELSATNEQIGSILKVNPVGYAKLTSVDVNAVLEESSALYLDTSDFYVEATPSKRDYSLGLKIKSDSSMTENQFLMSAINNEDQLVNAVTRKIEPPCTLGGVKFMENLNEIKINYSCSLTDNRLRDIGL